MLNKLPREVLTAEIKRSNFHAKSSPSLWFPRFISCSHHQPIYFSRTTEHTPIQKNLVKGLCALCVLFTEIVLFSELIFLAAATFGNLANLLPK